jgi:hypothetical protein
VITVNRLSLPTNRRGVVFGVSILMLEKDMEDLIASYPDDFFPRRSFTLTGRQRSFAGIGRFDLTFEDEFKSISEKTHHVPCDATCNF